jgi:RNA polymerase sigma-70 factor (ECF subfamily)
MLGRRVISWMNLSSFSPRSGAGEEAGLPDRAVPLRSGVSHATPSRKSLTQSGEREVRLAESGTRMNERDARLVDLLRRHHAGVWRMLRRLGVAREWIDDVLQEVFLVASERLDDIEPGKERSFLLNTAVKKAANHRRKGCNRNEVREAALMVDARDPLPDADQLLAQKRFREIFDDVLEGWPIEVRSVFVMFELEGLSVPEIAEIVEIKEGTVASRLRRGRELFSAAAKRLRARGLVEGSGW